VLVSISRDQIKNFESESKTELDFFTYHMHNIVFNNSFKLQSTWFTVTCYINPNHKLFLIFNNMLFMLAGYLGRHVAWNTCSNYCAIGNNYANRLE
jgi:hypothetical protein